MADIAITAVVLNAEGVRTWAVATIKADLDWVPLEMGHDIEKNAAPRSIEGIEIGTEKSYLKWPVYLSNGNTDEVIEHESEIEV